MSYPLKNYIINTIIGGTEVEVKFKIMDESDVKVAVELCNLCFDEETDYNTARRIFIESKYDKNQIYVIGYHKDQAIAHLKITVVPTMYKNMGKYAILNHVCIHPDYRRHHFGTKLLDYGFKICKDLNCKAVKLWSMNFRVAAHSLYKKYGFSVVDAKFFENELK